MCALIFFFLFCGFKRFIDGVSTETWDKGFVSALVFLRMETCFIRTSVRIAQQMNDNNISHLIACFLDKYWDLHGFMNQKSVKIKNYYVVQKLSRCLQVYPRKNLRFSVWYCTFPGMWSPWLKRPSTFPEPGWLIWRSSTVCSFWASCGIYMERWRTDWFII